MLLSNFQETLKQLGSDDAERGKVLGVSERTVRLWKAREPRIIQILASNPALARALARDAEVCQSDTGELQNTA